MFLLLIVNLSCVNSQETIIMLLPLNRIPLEIREDLYEAEKKGII